MIKFIRGLIGLCPEHDWKSISFGWYRDKEGDRWGVTTFACENCGKVELAADRENCKDR